MPGRGLLLALTVLGLCLFTVAVPAAGGDCVRPARAQAGQPSSLADLGELALERLPWSTKIVRANLSAERPVAVAGCYLMADDLLVVSNSGMVYCMSRRDLTPRWVSSLKAPLAALPSEGPNHYTFLVKATDGAYWIHAFRKPSGGEELGFPARLPFACTSGVTNNGARVFVGSLGSPRNNKTLESLSLADGRSPWGYRTRGILWAAPVVDPSGNSVILAGEDGTVTSLPAGTAMASSPNWKKVLTAGVTATPVVTPEHVVVGAHDGTVRCLELGSGEVLWMHGLDMPIRQSPWVLGRTAQISRGAGAEGAGDVMVSAYGGVACVRNGKGFFAYDLRRGDELFSDTTTRRPICLQDRWMVTVDENGKASFRDTKEGYEVKGALSLKMFDLIPVNGTDGAIYGCTHDGGIVAAIPAP